VIPIRVYLALAALAAALAGGWYVKGVFAERDKLKVTVSAMESDIRQLRRIDAATSKTLTARVTSAKAIQQKATDVQVRIAQERPSAACVLTPDWRLLHDEAAAGAVPPAARGADAPASAASAAPAGR
jgi:hypothetical protein